jgi:Fe-S-cluster-containing hydrogenase component 2
MTCIDERCKVEAISLVDGTARIDEKACIGCGLCVTGCQEHAIDLLLRKELRAPPSTGIELLKHVAKEKGTLDTLHELYIR